jgi:hypothetical protein
MVRGIVLNTDTTESCLCLTILYKVGNCCFSGTTPIQLSNQNLVFAPLLRLNVPNPRKHSSVHIRPNQKWKLSIQNLVFAPLLRLNIPNPRKHSLIHIRPNQKWESVGFLCTRPIYLFYKYLFLINLAKDHFHLLTCKTIYLINIHSRLRYSVFTFPVGILDDRVCFI